MNRSNYPRVGRGMVRYEAAPLWVMLSVSPNAAYLYVLLTAHLAEDLTPTGDDIADLMGFKQASSVEPYIQELENIGAVAIFDGKVVVHRDPLDSYTGPRSVSDHYARRDEADPRGSE
ncbi:hypothetical protein AB0K21_21615 [Streptosporangium sp. NPDC049248]|uniref:hypothetical protein n=1 Tax=Streptosporangium sp. NPDC049248 TaxID=3155651 RepID=UPI003420A586